MEPNDLARTIIIPKLKNTKIISIAGKSGTGKTTLALQIAGYLLTYSFPYENQCIWLQASELFPKKRLRAMFSKTSGKYSYLTQNILITPKNRPCVNYRNQSEIIKKFADSFLPPDSNCLVIDNISHHLRHYIGNQPSAIQVSNKLNNFYNKVLHPLIMKCAAEELLLILIHEATFHPKSDSERQYFHGLYNRLNSVKIYLRKTQDPPTFLMNFATNAEDPLEYSYAIKETGLVRI